MDQNYWRDMYCAAIESAFQVVSIIPMLEAMDRGEEIDDPPPEFVFSIKCDCCGKLVNVAEVSVCWDCGRVECWTCYDNDEGGYWSQCEVCNRQYCDCGSDDNEREFYFTCEWCDGCAER